MASRSLVLCSVTHFCVVSGVCVWIIVRLEDPNMPNCKISNRVSHFLIFYLLVFDRIHDAMCLWTLEQGTEPPTAPQAPQCRLPTDPGVCALGWVKCREHISLLIILCIIVYVTNKAHLSLICIVLYLSKQDVQDLQQKYRPTT